MIDRAKAISKLELMRCNSEWNKDFNKALDRAIKILRQTDSEDCVSRQAVLDLLADWVYECEYDEVAELVKKLPSVTPTERTGEWIPCTKGGLPLTELGRRERQKWYGYKCSKCNFIYEGNALTESPFCSNCGAKMG